MSTEDYAGRGTLPPELEERVRSELSAGERLVWVGRPRPDLYRGQSIFLAVFGVFFFGVSLFPFGIAVIMTVAFVRFGAANGNGAGALAGCFPLAFGLFTLPFVLIGGAMVLAPFWMPKRVRRIAYALTDRRAVVCEPNWLGKGSTVRSYTSEGLGRMYRVDRAGEAGDLIFEEFYTSGDSDSALRRTQRGFMGVDRVREVEELVRLTLLG